MKFYLNGRLLFVDMIHRYAYVVVEGDRPPISYHFTRAAAERAAAEQRERRREYIRQFERALDVDEITRMQERRRGFIGGSGRITRLPAPSTRPSSARNGRWRASGWKRLP